MTRLDPPAAPGAITPHLAEAGEDTVLISWFEPEGGQGEGSIRMSRLESDAGGWSWQAPRQVMQGGAFFVNWADFPSVQQGASGSLLLHWLEMIGPGKYAYGVQLARSDDGGAIWRSLGMAHHDGAAAEHGFVSIVSEGEGFRAFWLDGRETGGGHAGAMTLRTAGIGDGSDDGQLLDARVCDCCQTAAGMTASGPVVVYRDRSEAEIRDISIVRRDREGWTAPAPVARDGWEVPGCPVNGPSLGVGRDGRRLAVAWFTAAQDRPRVLLAFSEDGGETFGEPVLVDGDSPVGRAAVAMDARGNAVVAWMGSGPEDAAPLLVRRVTPDGAGGGTPGPEHTVSLGPSSRAAGFPRLARAGDAMVVVWTQPGKGGGIRGALIPAALLESEAAGARASLSTVRAWDGRPGSMAPAYEAVDLEGRPFLLASHKGHPLLVNVWATWCVPCREEQPVLTALHHRHHAEGLRVVGVSVDQPGSLPLVKEHVARESVPYAIVIDSEDRASSVFRLSMIPATLLFDRTGALVWRRDGALRPDDPALAQALQRTLEAHH